ncbi:amino acid adenylation domain-containing protein isoform 1 [Cladophialophora immunda]|nr:amino acid adenylation domain-containing protein isoform 1 [Cladophialophora immunda]
MGSIQVDESDDRRLANGHSADILSTREADAEGFWSFKVAGLASDPPNTPTGLREDILLLAWLLVLLRTQDEGHVWFDWAYEARENGALHEPVKRRLAMDEFVTGLQDNIGQVGARIARHMTTCTQSQLPGGSGPVSLLLSTGSLSQTPEEANDQCILHLQVQFDEGRLKIRPVWQTENMLPYTMTRHVIALVDTVKMCLLNPDDPVKSVIRPTAADLDEIWKWNHPLPPSYNFCMHEVICQQAEIFKDKLAILSWDGSLTYAEVDRYSTSIAYSLKEMGVELHDVLPVCFEKSRWTIVAVLAVMKAGATFVLMDPTLPLARLQTMAKQVGAKTMLTSRKQHEYSAAILPDGNLMVVEEDSFKHIPCSQVMPKLTVVPPSTLMYIIFTSGSTGVPKGVLISHETYTSSAFPRAEAVGYTEHSRVLDFASYAFDVSIDSMLCTLSKGGCLCIPSDEDRMNDLNGAMRRMQVNYAGLTPSVARILDADVVASLSALGLGGEAATAREVTRWGQVTRIVIGYGPSECTIGCTVNSSAATGRDYVSLGRGNGAAIWIVDPTDHELLMPVGAVGELLVEGPIVGQGYLNDPDKTAAAFISDPLWLTAGHNGYEGRRGRLYKTGDLGKYDPDGSGGIVFIGRKDTQVKLRGQRVELGEIEYQLKARLPPGTNVIAEVIVPSGSGGQPTLMAFIAFQSMKGQESTDLQWAQPHKDLQEMLSAADAELAKVLPRYMVPTAYVPVNYIPVMISGKTDRKRLRQFGATFDLRQLDQATSNTAPRQLSDLEQLVRLAWSQTLQLDPETIRPDDNFFALGGDSLMAMKLVSGCRAQGLDVTVANIFRCPTLLAMADIVQTCSSQTRTETPAFSMISQDAENIYPCTPSQESLFTFSIKSTRAYIAQRIACIPSQISLDAWKKAWEEVVAASPMLRTRLVQLQDPGLQQVVLRESIFWRHSTDLSLYLDEDQSEKMELGQSLARYAIVDNSKDDKRYMVWTIHHVLYDGWSEPLILQKVSNALRDEQTEPQAEMKDFVRYVRDVNEVEAQEFWRQELDGAVGPQFPRLPSRDYLPTPDGMLEHQFRLETNLGSTFTIATLIRGAWSLVMSQYTGSDDIVFGETLTGRDIPLAKVESIEGPLIATLPLRIRINRTSSVQSYLQTVQEAVLVRTPYQHVGMQNIRKVSRDAQHACETGTGLVIQPEPEYVGTELGFGQTDVVHEALHFNPYPLMLAFGTQKGGLRVCASFDTGLIDVAQMKRVLAQLETACLQLMKDPLRRLNEISCLPETELDQIWRWNKIPPLSLDKSSGRLRADASIDQGSTYPPAVVSWVCNPQNPSLLSPIGSIGELWLEGSFFAADNTSSPTWLLAGSSTCAGRSGTVQPTGDLVQLQDDSSLVFIGRKENRSTIQGHVMDIADLEAHVTNYLPSTTRAAAAVFQSPPDGNQQSAEHELVVFVEQQPSQEEHVPLMAAKHDITYDAPGPSRLHLTVHATIHLGLAIALKKLDKFIQDSLPPYMLPSAYIVVDKIPTEMGRPDHKLLNQIASRIPRSVLTTLQESLKEVWKTTTTQTSLTTPENIVRSAWAKILRISPEKIDLDDNFFRLGGDSVLAMKLASSLRVQGHTLTVADIFQNMKLRDAARVLRVDQVSVEKTPDYKPFSMLDGVDVGLFLSDVVRPKLADPRWSIQDVMPVTESQAIDVRATIQVPRTSIQYTMLYFEKGLNLDNLIRACNKLVTTHDILRTVFIEHESSLFQTVLDELESPVSTHQSEGDLEQYVVALCKTDIESDLRLGTPFLKMFHVKGPDGKGCLIIRLSHAQYDGISLPRLLRDLETLYAGGTVVDFRPFSAYMARVGDGRVKEPALNYWRTLLQGSKLSILEGPSAQHATRAMFLTKPVDAARRPAEITTASLLAGAWALVLARRLQQPDVTFGCITSGRNMDMPDVEKVMGPCYQFTPVRVPFEAGWTAMDLLRFVQRQSAESAANDFVGFGEILRSCNTQWSLPESSSSRHFFFDSVVHHQDFEDYDTMPFAGETCRVEIQNPHGDAAHPLKAVSFVQSGQTHVGVVGSERDQALIEALLAELAAAVEEVSAHRSEILRLNG